jgi:hypothetical protein
VIAAGERPSDFPLPQRGKFGRHARGSESTNRLGLAKIIGLTLTFQGDNDGRDRFLRWRGLGCSRRLEVWAAQMKISPAAWRNFWGHLLARAPTGVRDCST